MSERCIALLRGINVGGKAHIEMVASGPRVVFWSARREHITRSAFVKLPSLPGLPVYRHVTIRNHNTVRRLVALFEEL